MSAESATFQPIVTQRAFEAVVAQIKEAILDGKLAPGMRLASERKLMEEFGVSRTTVREALRALEQMGLCEVIRGPQGGVRIKAPSTQAIADALGSVVRYRPDQLPELVEARIIIESQIARLAAERANEEDLAKLEELVNRMLKYVEAGPPDYTEADWSFHLATAAACRNFVLESVLSSMGQSVKLIISGLSEYEGYRRQGVIEHKHFLSRLRAHDSQGAAEAIYRMLSVPSLKAPS